MSILTNGTAEEAGMDPSRLARLAQRAPSWVDGRKCRTAVMLAARRGKIVFHHAYGPLTDQADSQPAQLDSIFPINSITKPIVSTAVMCLVEDGLLGLNRPIREYIPEICGEGTDAIEVRHIITHSSGFREEESWQHYAARNRASNDASVTHPENQHPIIARYLDRMMNLKSYFTPGSQMHYCNHHNVLLLELVRRISGQRPENFVRERIFAPLDMESASLIQEPSQAARQVVRGIGVPAGKTPDDNGTGLEDTWQLSAPWGFIGANMNALDLAKFGQLFLNRGKTGDGQLLSPATVFEMTRDQLPGIKAEIADYVSDESSFGLGWLIQGNHRWPWHNATLTPKGTFWQSGAGGNLLWVDPVNEIVGVYLSVCLIDSGDAMNPHWDADLFMNAVTAAAVD